MLDLVDTDPNSESSSSSDSDSDTGPDELSYQYYLDNIIPNIDAEDRAAIIWEILNKICDRALSDSDEGFLEPELDIN